MDMREVLIGREAEQDQLRRCMESQRSEFVIVYGRRRVGKTFLVRRFFNNNFTFCYVGARNFTYREQLANFAAAIKECGKQSVTPRLNNWIDAFEAVKELIAARPREERKVLFFDEMPWIDNAKQSFVKALENFWNGWVAGRDDIVLIACGSSTSWMVDKLVMNRGGLHNRITATINLKPFTLHETEAYLQHRGISWDRYTILQCYMVMGGVPYYLSKLDEHSPSLAANIDSLFFAESAPMAHEFDELYNALFAQADKYIEIVKLLGEHREGLTATEIAKLSGIDGGWLTRILKNLLRSDLAVSFKKYGNKSRGQIYRLCDFFTLFYLRHIMSKDTKDENYWSHSLLSPAMATWYGQSFELVVLRHLRQVKKALGIDRILNSSTSWRTSRPDLNAQIDLVIERADRIINLCEIKFSTTPYIIDKEYEMKVRTRAALFVDETRTRKSVVNTFITTYGVLPGKHSSVAQSEVTMDDLFEP